MTGRPTNVCPWCERSFDDVSGEVGGRVLEAAHIVSRTGVHEAFVVTLSSGATVIVDVGLPGRPLRALSPEPSESAFTQSFRLAPAVLADALAHMAADHNGDATDVRLHIEALESEIAELRRGHDLPRVDKDGCYTLPDGGCAGCPHCPHRVDAGAVRALSAAPRPDALEVAWEAFIDAPDCAPEIEGSERDPRCAACQRIAFEAAIKAYVAALHSGDPEPPRLEHRCGVRGFDQMQGDVCPACASPASQEGT